MAFKPNIYPIMYWALAYGVLAGVILFVVFMLSRFITVIWFPVFLAGLIWGGFRNYRKQRGEFERSQGQAPHAKPVMQEFREAVADIAVAGQEMMAEQVEQDAVADQQYQPESAPQQPTPPEQTPPPTPPTPPPPPTGPTA